MSLAARFQQKAAAPAVRRAAPRRSKYAGVSAASVRHPEPNPGEYLLRVVETIELSNPKSGDLFRATFEVVESEGVGASPKGATVVFLQSTSGKAQGPGTARVKRFVMSAVGLEDETEYDAFDPEGYFIDACCGIASQDLEADPIRGRLIYAKVTNGSPREDGTYWLDFSWASAEQPEAAAQ